MNEKLRCRLRIVKLSWSLGVVLWLIWPRTAAGYRPFFSTDGAVADKNEMEIELGVVDLAHRAGESSVDVPSLRFNYGFAERWEMSAEFSLQVYHSQAGRDLEIVDPEFSIKHVLIEGPLQKVDFPVSLAFELGLMIPETVPESTWGYEATLIGSWRTGDFTWHLNGGMEWQREIRQPNLMWGLIVEHPLVRDLRVAMEINGASGRGSTADTSMLLGLLWEHNQITWDAGIRFGLSREAPDVGFTMGLTFKL
jgi:hypothetical protein